MISPTAADYAVGVYNQQLLSVCRLSKQCFYGCFFTMGDVAHYLWRSYDVSMSYIQMDH